MTLSKIKTLVDSIEAASGKSVCTIKIWKLDGTLPRVVQSYERIFRNFFFMRRIFRNWE